MGWTRSVLWVGDRVVFDGDEHSVVGLSGSSVRLRADSGVEQVVLAAHLMAAVDFAVLGAAPRPAVEPFGCWIRCLRMWLRWREDVVEVGTGLPPNPVPGARPRDGYDPAVTSMAERQRAKAVGVGLRTIEGERAGYAAQGLWGLVDGA